MATEDALGSISPVRNNEEQFIDVSTPSPKKLNDWQKGFLIVSVVPLIVGLVSLFSAPSNQNTLEIKEETEITSEEFVTQEEAKTAKLNACLAFNKFILGFDSMVLLERLSLATEIMNFAADSANPEFHSNTKKWTMAMLPEDPENYLKYANLIIDECRDGDETFFIRNKYK